MKKSNLSTISAAIANQPTAKISINRSLLPIYKTSHCVKTVFMHNNSEYEIELYNPTQVKYLAKIYLDGKLISNTGLVLRPGERVWLERFFDDDKKFTFKTYEVENTKQSETAIQNNGDVRVEFFAENTCWKLVDYTPKYDPWVQKPWYQPTTIPYTPYEPWVVTCSTNYFSHSTGHLSGCSSNLELGGKTSGHLSGCSSNLELNCKADNIETGMTEKGSKSKQKFASTQDDFNVFCSYVETMKIMPMSTMIDKVRIRKFCKVCGKKIKEGWKHCPSCGADLNK